MKYFYFKTIRLLCVFIPALMCMAGRQSAAQEVGNSFEQTDPPGTQFYQNRYLGNPAFTRRSARSCGYAGDESVTRPSECNRSFFSYFPVSGFIHCAE